MIGRGGKLGNRDRRGVGRNQRARRQRGAEVLQDLDLQLLVLGRGLNGDVAVADHLQLGRRLDPRHRRVLGRLVDDALGDLARHVLLDGRQAGVDPDALERFTMRPAERATATRPNVASVSDEPSELRR